MKSTTFSRSGCVVLSDVFVTSAPFRARPGVVPSAVRVGGVGCEVVSLLVFALARTNVEGAADTISYYIISLYYHIIGGVG